MFLLLNLDFGLINVCKGASTLEVFTDTYRYAEAYVGPMTLTHMQKAYFSR